MTGTKQRFAIESTGDMQTLKASKYGLSAQMFPASILDVVDHLTKAGYQAYIVGGGVRDMMLGLNPKDFDAVTNATPTQIKQVFGRRCRIIGKRFELAHVHAKGEIIEVATFRATPKKSITDASGMILRDNHWGTIEDDFARRDFSVNALYYQPRQGVILDFCGAVKDVEQRRLRLLGDAATRFEEDPVRMLRAIRFAAKLNFDLDGRILQVLNGDMSQLLRNISPHRLYDEAQKLFTSGALAKILPMLIHYQIWQHLLQDVPAKITPLILHAAKNTDLRLQQGKTINPAYFFAVLLWQNFADRCKHHEQAGKSSGEARVHAGLDVLKRQSLRTVIPRFAEIFIRETWEMQARLLQPKASHIMSLLNHARFRAGFDFLAMREKVQDVDSQGMVDWWEHFQNLSTDDKQKAIADYQRQMVKKRHQQKAEQAAERAAEAEKNQAHQTTKKTRKAKAEPVAPDELAIENAAQSELEPLLTDERTQRYQKAQLNREAFRATKHDDDAPSEKHPLLRRKKVKRDLSQVIFGPVL